MNIADAVVLVSGSNRGIGREIVKALAAAGARKIYAGARDTAKLGDLADLGPVETLALDITDPAKVAAAAARCGDINLLINNAGINFNTPLIAVDDVDNARREVETNYLGTLGMIRAFAPVLKGNGGGTIVNMISILARVNLPAMGSLAASKAAALSMTQGVRAELAAQGTTVIGVMPGSVDTDMTPGGEMKPQEVAAAVIEAIGAGTEDVYPGDMATGVAAGLANDPKAVEKQFAEYLPG